MAAAEPRAKLIYTRTAEPGEKMTTLDGQERALLPSDILVCDELGPTSLAGVMGGAISEVQDDTNNVLFEVASWHNISIRKTARHHDLPSEASFRFSRGLHPAQAMLAQKRGLYLLQQLTGGQITKGIVDAYPHPLAPVTIDLDPNYVRRIVGMEIPDDEMARILQSLEFEVEFLRLSSSVGLPQAQRNTQPIGWDEIRLRVTSPDHRTDIEGQHDLAEEIGRIYGYDKLPVTLMADEMPPAHGNPQLEFEERIKDALMNAGLSEIISYRMTTPEQEAKLFSPGTPPDDRPYVKLLNPINPERSVMRHSLLSGALEALSTNLRHHKQVKLFEVGSVYLAGEGDDSVGDGVGDGLGLPDEPARLVVVMSGASDAATWKRAGNSAEGAMDFFDLKGAAETLLDGLNIQASYEATEHPSFYPGRTAAVNSVGKNSQRLGVIGELHPRVREAWGLPDQPVLVADLDVAALQIAGGKGSLIQDVPRFPSVEEDLAVIVNEDVKASDVHATIERTGGNLLSNARLFDVYRGEQLGAGKKSLAYALSYQAEDRTLSDKDIEKIRGKIIRSLEANLGATIRK
jgi:phenylalanyl-tRNA synthetase beta chain